MFNKQRCLFFFIFIINLANYAESLSENVEIEISDGKLSGYFDYTYSGRKLSIFKGIPYAKPPVRKVTKLISCRNNDYKRFLFKPHQFRGFLYKHSKNNYSIYVDILRDTQIVMKDYFLGVCQL